jgi:GT2 family glycosyltransferase
LIDANRACFDAQMRVGSPAATFSGELQKAQDEVVALRMQLAGILESKSWRLTAPLRFVLRQLRGLASPVSQEPLPEPASGGPLSYTQWIAGPEAEIKRLRRRDMPGNGKVWAPRLALVVLAGGTATPEPLEGCDILHPGEADPFEFALSLDADFVCFHDTRDQLAPDALLMMREALTRAPQTALAFADEDWLDEDGARTSPFFKPGWDAELARGRDVIGPFVFFSLERLRDVVRRDGAAWRVDLGHQIVAMVGSDRILHIPAVLCHRAAPPPPLGATLSAQLAQDGAAARLEGLPDAPALHRVIYNLPAEPLVSILICTRDRADLLRICMNGILHKTDYGRFEIILVDNDSTAPEALALFAELSTDPRVTVLREPGAFNWAALNNKAAAHAAGEILLLLNNDIAMLEAGWLRELVAQAVQPGVGAVGAKLLYPDGRVQHAGLSVNDAGGPAHLFRFVAADAPGVCDMIRLTRELWAVTGACMAVPRRVFEALGGLNESLQVVANDIEFCLRLGALGYRIIFTPWAVLEHHEQATRLPDDTDEKRYRARCELDRMLRDWGPLARHDSYLNPNLMLLHEQPVLRDVAPCRR